MKKKIQKKDNKIWYGIALVLVVLAGLLYLKSTTKHTSSRAYPWEIKEENGELLVYEKKGSDGKVVFIEADTLNYAGDPDSKTIDSEFFHVLTHEIVKENNEYRIYRISDGIIPDCIGIYKDGSYQPSAITVEGFPQPSDTWMCGNFDFEKLSI